MAYNPALRSDLQDLLNKHIKMRDKFSALQLFSAQQQTELEFERKQSEKMKNKLKSFLCHWVKNQDQYKASLNELEKENKELKCSLAEMKREREFAINAKVSTLQDEVDFLRQQATQLKDKYSEQITLQERRHEDEISKYKHLLENANTKLCPEQNVKKGKKQIKENNKSKIIQDHPAFVNKENKWGIKKKSVSDEWSTKIVHKKRRLFYQDQEIPVDI